MSRSLVLSLSLVILPAAGLAYLAFGVVGRGRRDDRAEIHRELTNEAEAVLLRLRKRVEKAKLENDAALDAFLSRDGEPAQRVGVIRGGLLSYDLAPERVEPSAGDRVSFERAIYAGEDFEFSKADLLGALDAYSFYASKIRSEELRDRLRFRMARAAASAERPSLALELWKSVFEAGGERRSIERGFPVDVLAGLRILESDPSFRKAVYDRVRERLDELPTGFLARLRSESFPSDALLRSELDARALLEDSLRDREAPPELSFDGATLVSSRSIDADDSVVCTVATVPVADVFSPGRVEYLTGTRSLSEGAVTEALVVDSKPLGWIRVSDPKYFDKLATIDRRWNVIFALVLGTTALGLLGAVFLVQSVRRSRRLAELRAQLITNVSHELKTPVTSMRIFSEMLAGDPLDTDRTRKFGRLLRAESLRLSQLIENLLDSSQLTADRAASVAPVDLAPTLGGLSESFAYRAARGGVDFRCDASLSKEPICAVADAQAVERILLNLLDNALKYGRKERGEIQLRASRDNGAVCLTVSDNGPGIGSEDHERVFEEFHRLNYEDYSVRGAGLGLSLSRRLARAMGGDLRLRSERGSGCEFSLHLTAATRKEPNDGQ
ncbi:MAG: HAMP domain-containing sensor histidine kinase [Planctomycetota bacterium]